MTEHFEQTALVQWAAANEDRWPELHWLFHVANGRWRDKRTASLLRLEGLKRGVPDLLLLVPRGRFHGLALEMKSAAGRLTREQREWLAQLEAQGYATAVAHSWQEGRDVLLSYLAQ